MEVVKQPPFSLPWYSKVLPTQGSASLRSCCHLSRLPQERTFKPPGTVALCLFHVYRHDDHLSLAVRPSTAHSPNHGPSPQVRWLNSRLPLSDSTLSPQLSLKHRDWKYPKLCQKLLLTLHPYSSMCKTSLTVLERGVMSTSCYVNYSFCIYPMIFQR